MVTVLVVGSAAIDEQVSADGVRRTQLGGVVTYAGATFAREGLRAVAVSNLDARSEPAVRATLAGVGVEVCAGTSETMTRFQNRLLVGGGRRQQIVGVAAPIGAALMDRALAEAEAPHVHLGPLHGADIGAEALRVVAASGCAVTLDVQGLVRRGEIGAVQAEVTPLLEGALMAARIVKADGAELEVVRRAYGLSAAELLARFDIEELVVTAGDAGGSVLARGGERVPYPAVIAGPEVDATGAGDVFFAAYLAARVHRRASVIEAAAHAAGVAGQHVAGHLLRASQLALPGLAAL